MSELLPKDLLEQRFPDWYRAVGLDLNGETIALRRAMVESMAARIEVDRAPDLVAYAHGRSAGGATSIEWIRETCREHDEAFAAEVGDAEPKVLAAAAIAHRLASDPGDQISSLLSLLVLSAKYRKYKSAARSQELPEIARRQLATAAESALAGPRRSASTAQAVIKKAFGKMPDEFPTTGNGVTDGELAPWLSGFRKAAESTARRLDSLEKDLVASSSVNAEALGQTAWLLDEYSEISERAWGGMNEGAALIAATELGQITVTPALDRAAVMLRSTLLKAGRDPKANVDSPKAVQRARVVSGHWPEELHHELLPLLSSMDACRQMKGKTGWRDLAKEFRGGAALPSVSEGELADQVFREFLIARQLGDG